MSKKLHLLALVAAAALSTSALAQVRTGAGEKPDYPTNATVGTAAGASAGVAAAAPVGEAPNYPLPQGGAQNTAARGQHAMQMGVKHNHENFQKSPN